MTQRSLFGDEAPIEPKRRPSRSAATQSAFTSSVWVFDGKSNGQLLRWYGTLPPQLVQRLLGLYAVRGGTFVDGFLGQGDSLPVASRHGMVSRGFDVNPLAVLAVRTRLAPRVTLSEMQPHLDSVASALHRSGKTASTSLLKSERFAYSRKWFDSDTLLGVSRLFRAVARIEAVDAQRLGFLAASQLVRDVANIDARCTHHLVTKRKPTFRLGAIASRWMSAVSSIAEVAAENPVAGVPRASAAQGSILASGLRASSVDLLLAHPPYLGMIHYHQIHRLSTDLLDAVCRESKPASLVELNCDYDDLRKGDVSTDREVHYRGFVREFAAEAARVVRPEGRCALIIGDQRHKGVVRHPETNFIQEMTASGFVVEERFVWLLQNNGGMHVTRRGHYIDHNYIVVFRREVDGPA